jgi:hypothetical protein
VPSEAVQQRWVFDGRTGLIIQPASGLALGIPESAEADGTPLQLLKVQRSTDLITHHGDSVEYEVRRG